MPHPFRCACGAMTGVVTNERHANHSRCYCEDCQAYARFLGREDELIDSHGGGEGIQTLPKDVRFDTGLERLACVRLSDRGMLRWYAACCNSPIAGTPPTSRLPFVGVPRSSLERGGGGFDKAFGPVRFCLYTSGARGQPKPEPFGGAGFFLWLIRNRLRARFTGGFRENPFFDTRRDEPIVQPRVLSPAERAQLSAS